MSAVCVLAGDEVHPVHEGNSFLDTESVFCEYVVELAQRYRPDVVGIEDLPHRLAFAGLVKSVCRMQGRIIERMHAHGLLDRVLFIQPSDWQRGMGVAKPAKYDAKTLGKWDGKEAARIKAESEYGYFPPDLLAFHVESYQDLKGQERQKIRDALKKLQTDHVDAYLMAQWLLKTYAATGTFDTRMTQRYER